MAFQKGFLRLRRINPVDRLAGVRQTEDEHVALGLHPVQHNPDLAEVHLGLRTWSVLLRDERLHPASGLHIDLRPRTRT
jgi:hypothetical protein